MLSSWFGFKPDEPIEILCLGAHCDDVEIGCGGTLMTLAQTHPDSSVHVRVLSSTDERKQESERALGKLLASFARVDVEFRAFPNSRFPSHLDEIKDYCETLKSLEPDLIFTHYGDDHHQDHRTISALTRNTFRDHLILEYEILKYDGDLGNPGVFVPLEAAILDRKNTVLMECFPSQSSKHWFAPETFAGLARVRGVQCASPTSYAEAFYAPKMVISPPGAR